MSNESALPKTVLITGASAGIGKAIAHVFARHEFDVILVARREDKLSQVQQEIKQQYGQMAYVITEDLADPAALPRPRRRRRRRPGSQEGPRRPASDQD